MQQAGLDAIVNSLKQQRDLIGDRCANAEATVAVLQLRIKELEEQLTPKENEVE